MRGSRIDEGERPPVGFRVPVNRAKILLGGGLDYVNDDKSTPSRTSVSRLCSAGVDVRVLDRSAYPGVSAVTLNERAGWAREQGDDGARCPLADVMQSEHSADRMFWKIFNGRPLNHLQSRSIETARRPGRQISRSPVQGHCEHAGRAGAVPIHLTFAAKTHN